MASLQVERVGIKLYVHRPRIWIQCSFQRPDFFCALSQENIIAIFDIGREAEREGGADPTSADQVPFVFVKFLIKHDSVLTAHLCL